MNEWMRLWRKWKLSWFSGKKFQGDNVFRPSDFQGLNGSAGSAGSAIRPRVSSNPATVFCFFAKAWNSSNLMQVPSWVCYEWLGPLAKYSNKNLLSTKVWHYLAENITKNTGGKIKLGERVIETSPNTAVLVEVTLHFVLANPGSVFLHLKQGLA